MKIQINGFDLDGMHVLEVITKEVETLKDTLKTLWIHTSHLTSCDLDQFEQILLLTHKLGSINFEEISLQFSHWKFANGPPAFKKLEKVFEGLIARVSGAEGMKEIKELTGEMSNMEYKKFRLEMSGWFYEIWEAKWFLGFALTD